MLLPLSSGIWVLLGGRARDWRASLRSGPSLFGQCLDEGVVASKRFAHLQDHKQWWYIGLRIYVSISELIVISACSSISVLSEHVSNFNTQNENVRKFIVPSHTNPGCIHPEKAGFLPSKQGGRLRYTHLEMMLVLGSCSTKNVAAH